MTVAGARHDLPKPFHVLATQNPLEQEGTYPLPEAQLDRFLMEVDVDYPDAAAERKILFDTTGAEETRAKAAMTADDLIAAQRLVRRLPVGESVVEAILKLVRSARPGPEAGDIGKLISWGPGPRASQALMLAVRARALLDGRFAPSVDDVLELAEPVLKHRMALTFAARAEGETIPERDQAAEGAHRIIRWPSRGSAISRASAVRQATGSGRTLADAMPRLILEARRVAATVIHGLHGRRRAGPGENFWQYRRFMSGEPAQNVDWRRSARDDHLYVREREWEASHTIWIWPDRSPSMAFASALVTDSKLERALVVAFALAEVLVQGGERVGIPGLMRPTASRNVIEKMAQAILHDTAERASLPPSFAPSPLSEIVMLSDLWSPIGEVQQTIAQLVRHRRARPRGADRRSGRGKLPLFRPRRIHRAGRRRQRHRRPRRDLAQRLPGAGGAPPRAIRAETDRLRLELRRPPHRPAGQRTAAGAAFAHGRQCADHVGQQPPRAGAAGRAA